MNKTIKTRMHLNFCRLLLVISLVVLSGSFALSDEAVPDSIELDRLEKEIMSFSPDPRYPHDLFALETLREALKGRRGRNGGIGACLVRERDGKIVARGHNRQYAPYFRSDLHAEMDLLTRYEERLKISRDKKEGVWNPRRAYGGLILFTSVEPCPMCLTRIINAGIQKVYFVAPDKTGGMATRLDALPPFWRELARQRTYAPALCSPAFRDMALKLFSHPYRQTKGEKAEAPFQ